jgi:hypothetical protein
MERRMMFQNDGWCPICRAESSFIASDEWLSENYICKTCKTLPRHRALVAVLDQVVPDWRSKSIHESSPTILFFPKLCESYSYSFYFEEIPSGEKRNGIRCENLEHLTFPDATFDIFITQAVFEHVLDPPAALKEIMRVVRDGGLHIFSVPKYKHLTRSYPRAVSEAGSVRHLCEPIYHGNPVGDGKSLVTWDYGSNLDDLLMLWSGYQTSCYALRDRQLGIDGEYNEIFVTRKRDTLKTPEYLATHLQQYGLLDQSPPGVKQAAYSPALFVRDLYIHILRREPDNEGLAFHLARLDGGLDPGQLVKDFIESPEARALGER